MLAFTRNWNFQRGKELREIESSYFLGATGSCTVTAGIRGQHNVSGAGSFCDSVWANTNKNKQTNKQNVHRAHLTADVIHMRSGVEPQQRLHGVRAGKPPAWKVLGESLEPGLQALPENRGGPQQWKQSILWEALQEVTHFTIKPFSS